MKSSKKNLRIILALGGLLSATLAASTLFVSCSPQSIPTGPATATATPKPPTNTPTLTGTPTFTQTGTITPPTVTSTPTITATPLYGLAPGSIGFNAFITNGNAQQAFFPLQALNGGTTIFITNMAWDSSGTSGRGVTAGDGQTGAFMSSYPDTTDSAGASMSPELTLMYVSGGTIPAFTTLTSEDIRTGDAGASMVQPGDSFTGIPNTLATNELLDSGNATGDKLLVFTTTGMNLSTGAITAPVNFISAIIWGPSTWTANGSQPQDYWDTCLPTQLTSSGVTYAIDLSANLFAHYSDLSGANTNQCALLSCSSTSGPVTSIWAELRQTANWFGTDASRKVFGLPSGGISFCSPLGWTAAAGSTFAFDTGLTN